MKYHDQTTLYHSHQQSIMIRQLYTTAINKVSWSDNTIPQPSTKYHDQTKFIQQPLTKYLDQTRICHSHSWSITIRQQYTTAINEVSWSDYNIPQPSRSIMIRLQFSTAINEVSWSDNNIPQPSSMIRQQYRNKSHNVRIINLTK